MSRPRMWRGTLLALAISSAAERGRAEPPNAADTAAAPHAEAFRLAWTRADGAETCPSEGVLVGRVKTRLQRDPFADAAPRVIEGSASRVGDVWRAELRILDSRGGVLGRRELETTGGDCTALADAALLAIVLTIDPNAPLSVEEAHVASFPVPSSPPRSVTPITPIRPATPECPPARACPRTKPGPSVAAFGVGAVGPLPRPALGVELDGQIPLGAASLLVSLRILPGVETSEAHLEAGLATGAVGACRAWPLGRAELGVCAQVEAGGMTAVALDYTPVRPGTYPWVALTAGPRLGWPRASTLGLDFGLSLLVPLVRQRFEVEAPGNPQFRAAPIGGLLLLGLRVGRAD